MFYENKKTQNMKKQYTAPAVSVCEMETTNMMAGSLRTTNGEANSDDALTKERDEEFVDIWGNNF